MSPIEISDPLFQEAVRAIDAGDVAALEGLLSSNERLVRDRADCGEGYFHRPYLLWFVAENPIRNGTLPANIALVARVIVQAAIHHGVTSLQEQLDYALGLVCSGCVARECGVQGDLIDTLVDCGARPDSAIVAALAHRELGAVNRLLDHGAEVTLLVAACTGRFVDVARLLSGATPAGRQLALAGAALHGQARALSALIGAVDLDAYSPVGFHPHATALHHAVDSGSLDAVKVLAGAGASLSVRDRIHGGTPLGWAEYLDRREIADYLRDKGQSPRYTIVKAEPRHVKDLAAIELAAAALLAGHAPASILGETTDEEVFLEAQEEGRLWVALAGDVPVGFALVEMLAEGRPHLDEVDVHPAHGRRGLGTALVRAVCDWAAESGYKEVTLTTFREVPWNMPFYRKLGFEEVPADELCPELSALVEDEASRGLDRERRAVMRRRTAR